MNSIEETRECVLVVDDEVDFLNLMVLHLRKKGYQVTAASDPAEAQKILEEGAGKFAVLVTDWMMPHMSGNSLVRIARRIDPQLEAILITSAGAMGAVGKKGFGAFDYLTKPLNSMKDLSEIVERAIIHRNSKLQNQISFIDSHYGRKLRSFGMKNKPR